MSNATIQVGPVEKLASGKALVRGTLGGSFGHDEINVLTAWVEGISGAVNQAAHGPGSVTILADLTGMERYSVPEVLSVVSEYMKKDRPLVYRIATFGGTRVIEMAEHIVSILAGTTLMKNFPDEKAALAWLNS